MACAVVQPMEAGHREQITHLLPEAILAGLTSTAEPDNELARPSEGEGSQGIDAKTTGNLTEHGSPVVGAVSKAAELKKKVYRGKSLSMFSRGASLLDEGGGEGESSSSCTSPCFASSPKQPAAQRQ